MKKIGLAQGRFHIIHYGHMEYLLECVKRCEYLLIGVTDPDPERAYFDYNDKIRTYDENELKHPFRSCDNPVFPFTFYERMQMIRLSLLENNVDIANFDIIPLPIHRPHLIKYYLPEKVTVFVTIYDDWGRYKMKFFKSLGYDVEVLWERSMEERFTTGTEVRESILNDNEWKHLVPTSVYKYIKENKIDEKLKSKFF